MQFIDFTRFRFDKLPNGMEKELYCIILYVELNMKLLKNVLITIIVQQYTILNKHTWLILI